MFVAKRYLLIIFSILFTCPLAAQTYDGNKGYSNYNKQDKSFFSPNLRAKHSISLGLISGKNTPFGKDSENYFGNGFHLGYNYLLLGQKTKIKRRNNKVKTRDIIKSSLGFHIDALSGGEFLITAKYYNPMIKVKGILITYSFLSEFGLGLHKLPTVLNDDQLKFNFSLELIRMRFYKIPLYLHFTTNYDLSNNFLNTERKNLQFVAGIRFYIYKKRYK
jgi:hypothetical protein